MPDFMQWPIAWRGCASASMQLMPRSQRSSSPWTMRQNVYGPHVQYWQLKLQYSVLKDEELAPREALIEALGGSKGLIRIGHPFRLQPLYNADVVSDSVPWSDGSFFEDGSGWNSGPLSPTIHVAENAAARATSVKVGGLFTSRSRLLRRGDLVEFRVNGEADIVPRLHRVIRDAGTDANGQTRIEITPPLRGGLAEGDMVVLEYPMSVFRLMDDAQGGATRNLAWNGTFAVDLIEALV